MSSRPQSRDARHKCDIIKAQLNELHDTYGLSWRKIAKMGEYKGIKPGTLWAIAKGEREIPDKFKARFGIPYEAPAPVCLVHGVVHCYDCQSQVVTKRKRKPRVYRSLFDWPVKELARALENREVLQEASK